MRKKEIVVNRTCLACPELYDVIDKENNIELGYIRLRHGQFKVSAKKDGGKGKEEKFQENYAYIPSNDDYDIVFVRSFPIVGIKKEHLEKEEVNLEPNFSDGIFDSEEHRYAYLKIAVREICNYHNIEDYNIVYENVYIEDDF